MLMGFIGSSPPSPPPAHEMPPEDGDDTGIRISAAARAATSRYRRNRSTLSRYAWAISLGFHGIVLVGAFIALKYYFRPPPAARSDARVADPSGIGSVITSADATDGVHGGLSITLLPEEPSLDGSGLDVRNLPPFVRSEPKTVATLSDLRPISGIDDLDFGASSVVRGSVPSPARRAPAATQPNDNAPK